MVQPKSKAQTRKKKPKQVPNSFKTISVRDATLLHNYMDPDSPTNGNLTQSARATDSTLSTRAAEVYGCKLIHSDKAKAFIDYTLNEANFGENVRMETIAKIGLGIQERVQETHSLRVDEKGNETITHINRTISTPTHRDQLRAIELICKMLGVFDENRVDADARGKAIQAMSKQILRDVSTERKGKKEKNEPLPQKEGGGESGT